VAKLLKISGVLIILLVVVIVAGVLYLFTVFPKVPDASGVIVEKTPASIARGRYLANHVAICMDCHSQRDWRYFSGPPVPNTAGMGGELFGPEQGFPGKIYASNITPAAVQHWSEGELIRAVTMGVNNEGQALFPVMPYTEYKHLSQDDLHAIIAYLRTLPPIDNDIPETELDFPVNLIVRTMPAPYTPVAHPDTGNSIQYGRYLAKISGCEFCHTPEENNKKIAGMEFSGGMPFEIPGGTVTSVNITPDGETGIGFWDRDTFVEIFKSYATEGEEQTVLAGGDFNSVMPWVMYSGMRDSDLGAIYDYLRTVKPVSKEIERWAPADSQQ
jgi:cytochrome c553